MANLQIPLPDTLQDEIKIMILNAAAQAIDEAVQRESKSKDWFNQKEACEWLGISFGTWQNWRRQGVRVSVIQGITIVSKQEINRFLTDHQI